LLLSAGKNLQIFDLDDKRKLKGHIMVEEVKFWKWISPETVAIVTESTTYHWPLAGDSCPAKVFDRHSSMAQATITNYLVDPSSKFLLLIGVAPKVCWLT
jgi:clathrin heavy chain